MQDITFSHSRSKSIELCIEDALSCALASLESACSTHANRDVTGANRTILLFSITYRVELRTLLHVTSRGTTVLCRSLDFTLPYARARGDIIMPIGTPANRAAPASARLYKHSRGRRRVATKWRAAPRKLKGRIPGAKQLTGGLPCGRAVVMTFLRHPPLFAYEHGLCQRDT